ncbi:hypothetical protein ABTB51_13880, partial [Acinetobacter baumannii]
ILMFITSFGEQNITYKCCSNFLIHLSFTDAKLFLYMVEGIIIQLLSSGGVDERERLLDYFLGLSDLGRFKIES